MKPSATAASCHRKATGTHGETGSGRPQRTASFASANTKKRGGPRRGGVIARLTPRVTRRAAKAARYAKDQVHSLQQQPRHNGSAIAADLPDPVVHDDGRRGRAGEEDPAIAGERQRND